MFSLSKPFFFGRERIVPRLLRLFLRAQSDWILRRAIERHSPGFPAGPAQRGRKSGFWHFSKVENVYTLGKVAVPGATVGVP